MIERRRLWWGSLLRPLDARGRESRTLAFVGLSWLAVSAKFTLDNFGPLLGFGPFQNAMSATEYAAVTGALLAIWLGREWIETRKGPPDA